jgi:hypothetical protein
LHYIKLIFLKKEDAHAAHGNAQSMIRFGQCPRESKRLADIKGGNLSAEARRLSETAGKHS